MNHICNIYCFVMLAPRPHTPTNSFQGDDRYTLLTNSVTLRTAYRTGSAAAHTGILLDEDSWLARRARYRSTDLRLTQRGRNTVKGTTQLPYFTGTHE